MIHFKNHFRNGFSLIETVIALTIIAVSIGSFAVLQQKVFRRVIFNTFKIQRLYYLKNMLLLPKINLENSSSQLAVNQKESKKIEKTFTDPETKVVYEQLPIPSDSALSRFEGLYQERVTAEWFEADKKRIADLYHYGFEMQEKKSEAR